MCNQDIIPFGKYAGHTISGCNDKDYLIWLRKVINNPCKQKLIESRIMVLQNIAKKQAKKQRVEAEMIELAKIKGIERRKNMHHKNTHLVIKREWLEERLSDVEMQVLGTLINKATEGRPEHSYYIVNTDETWSSEVKEVIERNTGDLVNV